MPDPLDPAVPAAFLDRMATLLGDDFPNFAATCDQPPAQGVRLNTLKGSVGEIAALLPWPLEPVPWCPEGLFLPTGARPGRRPEHAAGLFYVQEPSAMAVARALDIQPGHRVIDVAASPGGKATHLASLLQQAGTLVANDPVRQRIKGLGENLERWGARNAVMTNAALPDLGRAWAGMFDRVLVDAPCSGEGMFRKSAAAREAWSPEHVRGCAIRQSLLLDDAARLVAPGGLLLYSTCTFAPEENEERVCAFLRDHPGWELVPIDRKPGMDPGLAEWGDPDCPASLERMVRLWPHHARGEGHTLALLHAPEHQAVAAIVPARSRTRADDSPPDPAALALWESFRDEVLPSLDWPGRLGRRGDHLSLIPDWVPPGEGISVVRPGLPLGAIRPGRFEPAHALAMALPRHADMRAVDLTGEPLERYLRGETVESPGEPGWTLVTAEGFPLGWAKRTGRRLQNHYPRGLRWQGGRLDDSATDPGCGQDISRDPTLNRDMT
jgi:16S rRNA C967 or C1407 C5-methylase (RsmB/RsmF family)/NOL1/NOP2/fmu family ribosome biogenesis protein